MNASAEPRATKLNKQSKSPSSCSFNSSSFEQKALDSLRQANKRLTQPRRWVIQALAHSPLALNAYELKAELEQKEQPVDTVTIYRTLDVLEQAGLIHRLQSSGKAVVCQHSEAHDEPSVHASYTHSEACHRAHEPHSLLICQQCGQMQEAPLHELAELIQQIQDRFGFQVGQQLLEMKGQCQTCS